jgi:hypothetical protein
MQHAGRCSSYVAHHALLCLAQAADVDSSSKQHSKPQRVAAVPASPAALSATKQQLSQTLTPAASKQAQQTQQDSGKLAGAEAAAGAGVARAGTAAADGPGKFDPHQTQPGQLGAPVLPGAPHNPHFNGPPRPPCEDERYAGYLVRTLSCDSCMVLAFEAAMG